MSRDAWKRYAKGGSWFYEVVMPGFKYNMTDIQAALGLCQLHKLEAFQRDRLDIVQRYDRAFGEVGALEIPGRRGYVEHAWHLYTLRLVPNALNISRDDFIEALQALGIGISVHFIPVHVHPFYRDKYGYAPDQFPVAYENYRRMLSLPLYPGLSHGEVSRIIKSVLAVVNNHRR